MSDKQNRTRKKKQAGGIPKLLLAQGRKLDGNIDPDRDGTDLSGVYHTSYAGIVGLRGILKTSIFFLVYLVYTGLSGKFGSPKRSFGDLARR